MAFTLFSIPSMAFPSLSIRKFRQYHTEPTGPPLHIRHGMSSCNMRRFQAAENESDAPKPATCTCPFSSPTPPFQGSSRPRPNQGTSTPRARGRRPVTRRRRGRLSSRFGTCGGDLDSGGDSGGRRRRTGHPLLHALHHGGTTLGHPLLHALPPGDHLPPPCAGLHLSEGQARQPRAAAA